MEDPRQTRSQLAGRLVLLGLVGAFVAPSSAPAADDCAKAQPGASDYCADDRCGPCYDGEGDCDPGQCGPGLTCVEEGAVDRCRDAECAAAPGAGDYCASSQCGPCLDGEGDCDPGQCGPGLTCVEEGAVDRCRVAECAALPGAGDYCTSSQCGPCLEGEGDCDPGQCGSGLVCAEEGATDRCRPSATGCTALPGSGSYCASEQCGPCDLGEGDCDPGQCAPGLECVESGAVDRCQAVVSGALEVKKSGVWRPVCCSGSVPQIATQSCSWTLVARFLTDTGATRKLNCFEGNPAACVCDGVGETMHGINGWEVGASLLRSEGGPMYPDHLLSTCVVIDSGGRLDTAWTSGSCPPFRLR